MYSLYFYQRDYTPICLKCLSNICIISSMAAVLSIKGHMPKAIHFFAQCLIFPKSPNPSHPIPGQNGLENPIYHKRFKNPDSTGLDFTLENPIMCRSPSIIQPELVGFSAWCSHPQPLNTRRGNISEKIDHYYRADMKGRAI
jgi:hypothetical protein